MSIFPLICEPRHDDTSTGANNHPDHDAPRAPDCPGATFGPTAKAMRLIEAAETDTIHDIPAPAL
jgi:hypothetical protein